MQFMQIHPKNKSYVKLMSFFLFNNKTLNQNRNKNAIITDIIQIYLSTDAFATEKDFPKANMLL